jgi:hypothetical protein
MRRLILVRHAAPTQDRAVPARDWVLSPSRLAEAERLPAATVHCPRRC